MNETQQQRGLGIFPVLWSAGLISALGARVSGFAIGVELFRDTGSVTRFSLYGLCVAIPAIFLSPAAGAVADRFDRRHVLLLSSLGGFIGSVLLFFLVREGGLTSWKLYPILVFRASCGAFTLPAFIPALTLMVGKQHYARASGMISAGDALSQIVGPVLGGLLLVRFDVATLILFSLCTSLVILTTLVVVRFPQAPPKETPDEGGDVGADAAAASLPATPQAVDENALQVGWGFVRDRPGLLRLLLFGGVAGFSMGTLQMLFTPLVLSFAGPVALGAVLSIAAFGMLAGGLVMSIWGGPAPARRIVALLVSILVQSVLLLLAGFEPDATLVASAAFFYMLTIPLVAGISQAIWQSKTPLPIQGRVFAFRGLVAGLSVPLAIGAAGPLADYVFEPLLQPGGALAGSVGTWIGVGPGRGMGLMLVLLGGGMLAVVIAGFRSRSLRTLDEDVPDVVDSTPAPEGVAVRPGAEVAAALSGLGRRAVAAVAAVLFLGSAAAIRMQRPPAPAAADAPAGEVSAERALRHLEVIARRPHPTGSEALAEVRGYLVAELSKLGLETHVRRGDATETTRAGAAQVVTVENVVARWRSPSASGGKALMLVAHYDSAFHSPGAADDGAGVAMLLETARALVASEPPNRDVIFLFTDAEEIRLYGARVFVREDPWAADVGAVVNFEARGHGGPVYMFETGRGNAAWIPPFFDAAPLAVANSLMSQIYRVLPNDTDFTVFRQAGYAGFNLAMIEGLTHYHTPLDRAADVDRASLQHIGSYALGLARSFEIPPGETVDEDRAYLNVLGGWTVQYSATLAQASGLLAAALVIAVIAMGIRRRRLSWVGILQGFLGFLGMFLIVPVTATFVWILLRVALGVTTLQGSTGGAGFYMVALAAVGVAAFALLQRFFRRVAGVLNLAAGALVAWLVLVAATSGLGLPAPSNVLFVWPLIGSALVLGYLCREDEDGLRSPRTVLVVALGAVPAVLLLPPLVGQLYVGLQSLVELAGLALVVEVLLLGLLVPQLEVLAGRRPFRLPVILVLLATVLLAVAVRRSPTWYQDSLVYATDADTLEHLWLTFEPQPDPWTRQFGFEAGVRDRPGRFAPLEPSVPLKSEAPAVDLPVPEVETIGREPGRIGLTEHRLTLRAGSGVLVRRIWFEPAEAVPSIHLAGLEVLLSPKDDGRPPVLERWPPAAAEEMTVRVRGTGPVTMVVVDEIPGLPPAEGMKPRPGILFPRTFPTLHSDVSLVRRSFELSGSPAGPPERGLRLAKP